MFGFGSLQTYGIIGIIVVAVLGVQQYRILSKDRDLAEMKTDVVQYQDSIIVLTNNQEQLKKINEENAKQLEALKVDNANAQKTIDKLNVSLSNVNKWKSDINGALESIKANGGDGQLAPVLKKALSELKAKGNAK